jgi:predicted TIM-barrel fold metal-dependent hydrolase
MEDEPIEFRVFDSHIHVQPWHLVRPEALKLLGDKQQDLDEVRRMMYDPDRFVGFLDREGVERVCIINYVAPDVMGFTEEVNAFSGNFAKRHPRRIVAYGSVHPMLSRDPAGDVRRLREELGIRGLKVHPSHQLFYPNAYRQGLRALETIYATAQELGMPVMIHTGTSIFPGARNVYADPIFADDIGVDFPELRVILAHGGRPLWMPAATFLVRRFQNFWMDISSIPPQNLLRYFPELERLADRVLFGSDWPAPGVPGMRTNAERVAELPIAAEAKRKILFENAERLYPLEQLSQA